MQQAAGLLAGVTAVSTITCIPTTPFNLAAGAVLGPSMGTAVVLSGCVLGAVACFSIAKSLLRSWATSLLESSPSMAALDTAVSEKGLRIVVLARLSPVFPFSQLSYVLGVSRVSALQHAFGTALGVAPSVGLYCWMGHSLRELAGTTSTESGRSSTTWIVMALTAAAVVLASQQAQKIISQSSLKKKTVLERKPAKSPSKRSTLKQVSSSKSTSPRKPAPKAKKTPSKSKSR
eukprot:gene10372-1879_t